MVKLRDDEFLSRLYDIAVQRIQDEKIRAEKKGAKRNDPRLLETGFNHIVTRSDQWAAKNGGVLFADGKTSEKGYLVAKSHVGRNIAGRPGATQYALDHTPPGKAGAIKINGNGVTKRDLEALTSIAQHLLERSTDMAYEEYYTRMAGKYGEEYFGFDYLPVLRNSPDHNIAPISWKYISVDNVNRLLAEVSEFLKQQPGVRDAVARVDHIDDTMRIVSSEDIAVKEWFPGIRFGYEILLEAESSIDEGTRKTKRWYKIDDALYTTNLAVFDKVQNTFAQRVWDHVERFSELTKTLISRTECPDVTPEHDALVWADADSTAGFVHEAFSGHALCLDLILDQNQQPWNLRRFNSLITDQKISLRSLPTQKDPFGLYLPSSFVNDWEGMPGMKKELIKRGVLNDFYADRSTAWRANTLLRKLGYNSNILPGDSRTGLFDENSFHIPSPRTSTTEIIYHARMPKNWSQMKERFLQEIEEQNKDYGYYVIMGAGGFVQEQGLVHVDCPFAFRIYKDGSQQQVSGVSVEGFADQMFHNLVTMGNKKKYVPHRCAISDIEHNNVQIEVTETDPSMIRVGIITRDAIFNHLVIRPYGPGNGYLLK